MHQMLDTPESDTQKILLIFMCVLHKCWCIYWFFYSN